MNISQARNYCAAYADYNRIILPAKAGAKFPSVKAWQDATTSHELGPADNGCWILGDLDLVVDVDIKDGGKGADSFKRLIADLDITLTPNVRTASGGWHCYLRLPAAMPLAIALDEYPNVDFLSKGRQVVIAGSTTEIGDYTPVNPGALGWDFAKPCPPALLAALTNAPGKKNAAQSGDAAANGDDLESAIAADLLTETEVRDWLKSQSPDCDYQTWFAVLCRIKSWRKDALGYKIARRWSRQSADKYPGDDAFKRQWREIKADYQLGNKRGVGVGAIVKDARTNDKLDAAINNANELAKCKDKSAIAAFANKHKGTIAMSTLRNMLKVHIKKTLGVTLSVAEIGKTYGIHKTPAIVDDDKRADWLDDYCFCPPQNIFINVKRRQKLVKDAFNFEAGVNMPEVQDGSKMKAAVFCGDYGLIKRVDAIGYFPESEFAENHYVNDDSGKCYYNIFDPAQLCDVAEDITDDGQAAFDLIMKHFDYLVGVDNNKAEIMRQWLAHQVQKRGKLLRWAPFIQSGQGAGKSFLADLMSHLLGGSNVGKLDNDNLLDKFNDWAAYVCVNFCEEVHNAGETRDRIPNVLKPKITDSVISIRPIYGKKMDVPNRANYICFTNDPQGLPLEQSDRRWFVVMSPLQNPKTDLPRLVSGSYADYFDALWATLTPELLPQINRLLLDYPITDNFANLIGAPHTDDKASMLAAQQDGNDDWDVAEDTIAKPTQYYNDKVICSVEFFNAVEIDPASEITWSKWQRAKWLRHYGFKAYPKRLAIGKHKGVRVFVKDLSMSPNDVRDCLAGKPPTPNGEKGEDVPF